MCGVLGSIIKSTKRAIKVTINDHVFTEETIVTLLAGIESIINSHPLTPLSDDLNVIEALTPDDTLLRRPLQTQISLLQMRTR